MLLKLPQQSVCFLNATFSPLPLIRVSPSASSSFLMKSSPIVSKMFTFKLKHRLLSPKLGLQFPNNLGFRAFSTRSRPSSSRGETSASKSLIEDEAELSDWVSGLRTNSLRAGLGTEDEDSDNERKRRGSMKRRRESYDSDGFEGFRGRRERNSDDLDGSRRRGGGDFGARSNSKRRVNDDLDGFRGRRTRNSDDFDGFGRRGSKGDNDFGASQRGSNGLDGFRTRNMMNSDDFDGFGRHNSRKSVYRKRGLKNDMYEEEENEGFLPKRGIGSLQAERSSEFSNRQRGGRSGGVSREDREVFGRKNLMVSDEESDEDERVELSGLGGLLKDDLDDEDEDEEDVSALRGASSLFGEKKDVSAGLESKSPPKGSDSYLSETRFDECAISPLSLKGIRDAGYKKMTLVQEATLPVILRGKDVLAKAKTGTGKTVAFLLWPKEELVDDCIELPSIEVVLQSSPPDRDQKRPPILVLVICPTRELASQAAAEANSLLKYHPSIGVQVVIGGTRLALEQKRLQANPCQILVATPGRLRDHIENTAGFATRLKGIKVLVLDEADHLLDMGFRKEIERIIDAVPKQRQTLLFSATVPDEVRQICHIALKRDYEFINTVQEGSEETHAQVRQSHLVTPLDKHFSLLYVLLKEHISDDVDYKVLVFCTTAMVTKLVANFLGELNLNVREIHSRKPQSYRTRVSDEFRKSKGLILVTSDVSARGVDYPDVTLVIQIGLPADREQYIHRLGRTGRKGKEGQGILLLAPWEEFFLSAIKDLPMTKASSPAVDPDTRKKAKSAYQSWLGYYNSNKNVGRDKYRLVELANEFSRSMGLDNPPAIPKLVLGKMGLRNIPGLRSK
ncbi:DEAD/DEAH box helicase domain [Dillenia turbinata]|uniref:ATP-dependent RNA helicase n=1 Tax=Dillenia turbinata TaxID=194707 RepID=A0AAN8Z0I4_9MAGN